MNAPILSIVIFVGLYLLTAMVLMHLNNKRDERIKKGKVNGKN